MVNSSYSVILNKPKIAERSRHLQLEKAAVLHTVVIIIFGVFVMSALGFC